jgi:hypothetical protein
MTATVNNKLKTPGTKRKAPRGKRLSPFEWMGEVANWGRARNARVYFEQDDDAPFNWFARICFLDGVGQFFHDIAVPDWVDQATIDKVFAAMDRACCVARRKRHGIRREASLVNRNGTWVIEVMP